MLRELEKYKEQGEFSFGIDDRLSVQCNAPRHSSGIYIIYANDISPSSLIYVGISGREGADGNIVHRKDGIGGRIIKGKQFGDSRRNSWSLQMKVDQIETLHIKWYVTYGKFNKDFPRPIEHMLLEWYLASKGHLPLWNKKT